MAFLWCLLMTSIGHAQIGRGWLERLSGPGPFRMWPVIEARVLCLQSPEPVDDGPRAARLQALETALSDGAGLRKTLRKAVYPREANARGRATLVGCHFLPVDEPRFDVGFHASWGKSENNVLNYPSGTGLGEARQVNLRMFLVTGDIRVNRVLDVGAGIGRATFSSDSNLFPEFSRRVYQAMRLTTRPLAPIFEGKWAHFVLVQFDGTKFKGGFTAENFGATPGTYNEPGEMNWNWAIKFDLTAWIW